MYNMYLTCMVQAYTISGPKADRDFAFPTPGNSLERIPRLVYVLEGTVWCAWFYPCIYRVLRSVYIFKLVNQVEATSKYQKESLEKESLVQKNVKVGHFASVGKVERTNCCHCASRSPQQTVVAPVCKCIATLQQLLHQHCLLVFLELRPRMTACDIFHLRSPFIIHIKWTALE